jgi:hypothetical protein
MSTLTTTIMFQKSQLVPESIATTMRVFREYYHYRNNLT